MVVLLVLLLLGGFNDFCGSCVFSMWCPKTNQHYLWKREVVFLSKRNLPENCLLSHPLQMIDVSISANTITNPSASLYDISGYQHDPIFTISSLKSCTVENSSSLMSHTNMGIYCGRECLLEPARISISQFVVLLIMKKRLKGRLCLRCRQKREE